MTVDIYTEIHIIFKKGIFEVSAQRKFLACPESENLALSDDCKEKHTNVKRKASSKTNAMVFSLLQTNPSMVFTPFALLPHAQ